jgi:hypothetical protein
MTSLKIYTIYNKPKNYPDYFIAREFTINGGQIISGEIVASAKSLEGIRAQLAKGLKKMARVDNDPPSLVESWLKFQI